MIVNNINIHPAIKVLSEELVRLGGEVFTRYIAQMNPEVVKSIEAADFLNSLLEGNLKKEDIHYLQPSLDKLQEVNWALLTLEKALKEKDAK